MPPLEPSRAGTTVIDSRARRTFGELHELAEFYETIFFLVWRDIKVRYRQTVFGLAWAFINPIIGMGAFSFVFGRLVAVPTGGFPYPAFVVVALVPWTFFSRSIGQMTGSIINNEELVKKVYFPRLAIPLAVMLSCAVDMAVGLFVALLIVLACGVSISWQIVFAPVFIALLLLMTFGLGITLAALNVRHRDISYVVSVALQFLIYLTPVIYPQEIVPDDLRLLFDLNPLVGIIDGLRWSILGGTLDIAALASALVVSTVLFMAGLHVFARFEDRFVDVI